jgi:hypothetical protein
MAEMLRLDSSAHKVLLDAARREHLLHITNDEDHPDFYVDFNDSLGLILHWVQGKWIIESKRFETIKMTVQNDDVQYVIDMEPFSEYNLQLLIKFYEGVAAYTVVQPDYFDNRVHKGDYYVDMLLDRQTLVATRLHKEFMGEMTSYEIQEQLQITEEDLLRFWKVHEQYLAEFKATTLPRLEAFRLKVTEVYGK